MLLKGGWLTLIQVVLLNLPLPITIWFAAPSKTCSMIGRMVCDFISEALTKKGVASRKLEDCNSPKPRWWPWFSLNQG